MMPSQRFRICLAEAETGIVLDADGMRYRRGGPHFEPAFATRDEALRCKDELLHRYRFAEVVISDAESDSEPERFVDEVELERYLVEMCRWREWTMASPLTRLFMRRPKEPHR